MPAELNVANLVATLQADISKWQSGLGQAQKDLTAFEKQVNKSNTNVAGGFNKSSVTISKFSDNAKQAFASVLEELNKLGKGEREASAAGVAGFARLAAAARALVNPYTIAAGTVIAFAYQSKKALDTLVATTRQIQSLTAITDMSTEAASNLADAFTLIQGHSQGLQMAMFRLAAEVDAGGEALNLLGVQARDAQGFARPLGDVFMDVRDAVSEMGSAAARNSVLLQLFGRQGREMARVFGLSSDAFARVLAQADELGAFTEEQRQAAERYLEAQVKLNLAIQGFQTSWGTWLASTGASVLNWFSAAVAKARELAELTDPNLYRLHGMEPPPPSHATTQQLSDVLRERTPPPGEQPGPRHFALLSAVTSQLSSVTAASETERTMTMLTRSMLEATAAAGPLRDQVAAVWEVLIEFTRAQLEAKDALDAFAASETVAAASRARALALEQISQEQAFAEERAALLRQRTLVQGLHDQGQRRQQAAQVEAQLIDLDRRERVHAEARAAQLVQSQQDSFSARVKIEDEFTGRVRGLSRELQRDLLTDRDAFIQGLHDRIVDATGTATQAGEDMTAEQSQAIAALLADADLLVADFDRRSSERARAQMEAYALQVRSAAESIGQSQTAALAEQFSRENLILDQAINLREMKEEDAEKRRAAITRRYHADRAQARIADAESEGVIAARLEVEHESHAQALLARDMAYYAERERLRQDSIAREIAARTDRIIDAEREASREVTIQAGSIRRLLQQREQYIDDMATVNAERIVGLERIAARELEIEARTVSLVLAERQKIVESLNILLRAAETDYQLALRRTADIALLTGESATAVGAMFTQALTAGRDALSTLEQLTIDTATSMQRAFSDLFFDILELRFDDLLDVLRNWASQARRAIADAFANLLTRGIGLIAGEMGGLAGINAQATAAAATLQQQFIPSVLAAAAALGTISGTGAGGFLAAESASTMQGTGGSGFNALGGVPTNLLSSLPSLWSGVQEAWTIFSISLAEGNSFFTALGSAASEFSTTLQTIGTSLQGLGQAIAVVGATLAVANTIINFVSGETERAVGSLVGMIAGGIIGFFAGGGPWGAVAGVALGGWLGDLIGSLFGGGESKEEREARALSKIGPFFEDMFATLRGPVAGSLDEFQESIIAATDAINKGSPTFGIGASAVWVRIGDQLINDTRTAIEGGFDRLSGGQFAQLIRTHGVEAITAEVISQDINEELRVQIEEAVTSLLRAQAAIILAVDGLTLEIERVGETFLETLPAVVVEGFEESIIGPLREALKSIEGMPLEEAVKLMADLAAHVGQLALVSQVMLDIATITGDIETIAGHAAASIRIAFARAEDEIQRLQSLVADADTPQEQLEAELMLREAILQRYALERQQIAEIENIISGLWTGVGASFTNLQTQLALLQVGRGETKQLTDLLGIWATMASSSISPTTRGFAAGAGINALTAAMPVWVQQQIASGAVGANGLPGGLLAGGSVFGMAFPFLDAMSTMIGDAIQLGDIQGALVLTQQQAAQIQQIGVASVGAVELWRDSAIDAATDAANAQIAAVERQTQARIDGLSAEAEAIRDNADTRLDALRDEANALNKTIQATREWQRAVESMQQFLNALMLSGAAPLNPAEQLAIAQEQFASAFASFQAAPSAEGLTNLQASARALLAVGEEVFSRPSPQYQALFHDVTTKLTEAQAVGTAQIVEPVEVMEARLEEIQAEAESIRDTAEKQLDAINQQIESERRNAQETIESIRTGLQSTTEQIIAAADAEIAAIQAEMEALLTQNAILQGNLFSILISTQEALLASVTGGIPVQEFIAQRAQETVVLLTQIRDRLTLQLGAAGINVGAADESSAASPPPPAAPPSTTGEPVDEPYDVPLAQFGEWDVPRNQRYMLHRGEMVLPEAIASRVRAGLEGGMENAGGIVINIHGITEPEAVAQAVRREIDRYVRFSQQVVERR